MSPPNAPPRLEPRCCRRIPATSRMERIIWMYGNTGSIVWIIFIAKRIPERKKVGKRKELNPKETFYRQILVHKWV